MKLITNTLILITQTLACAFLGWGMVQIAIVLHKFVHSY